MRANLNIRYPEIRGGNKVDKSEHQAYITIANGTETECKKWIKGIIAGEHNMECKGHLYNIQKSLKAMSSNLVKIADDVEKLAQKQ